MAPKKVVQKPQPKAVKARRIINVGTEDGASSGLPLHAAHIAKKRQLKKALEHLYTKLAEKSTVDISQVRQVYEAMEKILTCDLKENGKFLFPGIATFFRKQLPARGDMGEKYVCGRLVKVPARGIVYRVKAACSTQLKNSMA